jgi:DTW domain-containing protein
MQLKYPGRCETCYMRNEVCICSLLSKLENRTPVTVIMHHRESYKTTNTARIACLMLKNSRILIRGLPEKLNLEKIHHPEYQSVLLTLNDRSVTLTPEWVKEQKRPLHLIVPDGSWRQASKMGKREAELQDIPWVKLPPGPLSSYHLRREHNPAGLSTLEAMARALAIIESPVLKEKLEEVFHVMVERTLKTRGPVQKISSSHS